MLQVKNLAEMQKKGNQTISILIYGESGSGKTTFASTSAQLGKVLYIDLENGTKFIDKELSKNIDIMNISSINDLDDIFVESNITEYKTVVIDSITDLLTRLIEEVKGGKENVSLPDWNIIIGKFERLMRKLRKYEKNVILIALSQDKEDENKIIKRPMLATKGLPHKIPALFDYILYIAQDDLHNRFILTNETGKYLAKCRVFKNQELPNKLEKEQINFKWFYEYVLVPAQQASPEQIQEVKDKFKELKITQNQITDALIWAGVIDIKQLTVPAYQKLVELLDKKLAMKK